MLAWLINDLGVNLYYIIMIYYINTLLKIEAELLPCCYYQILFKIDHQQN